MNIYGRHSDLFNVYGVYVSHMNTYICSVFENHNPVFLSSFGGRCGRDRMVVGFIPTYAISVYYH